MFALSLNSTVVNMLHNCNVSSLHSFPTLLPDIEALCDGFGNLAIEAFDVISPVNFRNEELMEGDDNSCVVHHSAWI